MPNFREKLAIAGNINRIIEMKDAGVGNKTIAGIFQDNGINITANDVAVIYAAVPVLSTRALPKREAQAAIQAYQGFRNKGEILFGDNFY